MHISSKAKQGMISARCQLFRVIRSYEVPPFSVAPEDVDAPCDIQIKFSHLWAERIHTSNTGVRRVYVEKRAANQ